jgi:hypothetical protein
MKCSLLLHRSGTQKSETESVDEATLLREGGGVKSTPFLNFFQGRSSVVTSRNRAASVPRLEKRGGKEVV